MAKRRNVLVALLLCVYFFFAPFCVQALSTSNVEEPIILNEECTLTLAYSLGGDTYSDVSAKLYKIADISSEITYSLTPKFASTNLIINGIKTQSEWNVICSTLEAYILADKISADFTKTTNSDGVVCFDNLSSGLYLVITDEIVVDNTTVCFNSSLISLPNIDNNRNWEYNVTASPKGELIPPTDPDEKTEFKVIKLWNDDNNQDKRPNSIEIEIFKNGTSYKTVTLSNENQWSHSWSDNSSGAKWTVIERNKPDGYTMTVEQRDNTIILTNIFIEDTPPSTPETGDTSNTMLYAIIMIISGSLLIIMGIIGKRNVNEETE